LALALVDLVKPPQLADVRAQVLQSLQGVGFVAETGTGTGSLTASGQGAISASVVVKISTSGELGTGAFQYSLDGGTTYSAAITIPAGAVYALAPSGATVTFVPGPVGAGTSFVAGDTFSFATNVPNFPISSWQSGGAGRTLVEVEAQALTDFGQALPQIAASGFLQSFLTPTNPPLPDAWMDLLGQNVYGLTRNPAVATQGNVQIVDSQSAGPFTITPGQLTFASTTGVLFSNTAGGTLAKGGLLVLPVAATTAGASGNVGLNSITSIVGGTLPGVTVSNPGTAGVWITVSGVDQETSQSYAIRAQNRWPSLGIGATPATYDYWARTASANVTRTRVFADAVTPGQVDVYLAGAAAPVAAGDVTAVQGYVDQRTPLTAIAVVSNATAFPVNVAATVTVKGALHASAVTQASTNLAAYINTLPISDGSTTIDYEVLTSQIGAVAGVVRLAGVTANGGTADLAIPAGYVATVGTLALTWVDTP
jgi:hypothetical protein